MNFDEQDKIQNQLQYWHQKKNIKCPSCKSSLFHLDRTPFFSSALIINDIVLIHHSPCHSSIGKCGKALYFCLSCGSQSSHTSGRLRDKGCKVRKCPSVKKPSKNIAESREYDVGCVLNNTNQSAISVEQNKTEDTGAINNHILGSETVDTGAIDNLILESEDKWDFLGSEDRWDLEVDLDAKVDTEGVNTNCGLSCSDFSNSLKILENRNEWSGGSVRFFMRDHQIHGNGLRGLVFNSVIDTKVNHDFSSLSLEDMYFHLHIASIHYGLPTTKSIDLVNLVLHKSTKYKQIIQSEKKELSDTSCKSIIQVLTTRGLMKDQDQPTSILQEVKHCVETELQTNCVKRSDNNSAAPLTHKTVRTVYIDGQNSIVNNLPIPTVSICNKAAYIPAREIINHILAMGTEVMFFRAGHEKDWVDQSGYYETNFLSDLHQNISAMKDVSIETRVILVRVWSDGFEAHQIKGKNEFNSLQIFTLTVIGPNYQNTDQHTVPFALCFQRKDQNDILIQLLKELKELRSPALRYWGGNENQVYPTMVYLEMISNDYPERCSNTGTTQNGTFTHRWRHSCIYEDSIVPSCSSCHLNYILSPPSVHLKRESSCDQCLDWWHRGVTKPKTYPIQHESFLHKIQNFPAIEISFEMIYNSVTSLQEWCSSSNLSSTQKGIVIKKYLQAIGFATRCIPTLCKDLLEGKEASESLAFPSMLRSFRTVDVEMKSFQTMPMHMCFLGIEKSLIGITSVLACRRDPCQNAAWHELTNAVQGSQDTINSVYLVWCLAMKFTDMDNKNLGTANWQSDHYLAFTRVSLFHFSPLEQIDIASNLDKHIVLAFRSMRVTWFCLISHIFAEEKVPTDTINVLVRLFLSSCRRLWIVQENNSSSKKPKLGDKRKATDGTSTKTNSKSQPFYVTKGKFPQSLIHW